MSRSNLCPCDNNISYNTCCGKIHENISLVETAEQLMRSRYTAFTKAMGDYLMLSHHSSTRPLSEKNDIEKWAKSVQWDRLEIISKRKGKASDDVGVVEFKAYFYTLSYGNKRLDCIHERSQFEKENGVWMYLSALDLD